ncbi:C-C chemokine receptor type 4-like isoform X2 [Polypterus senegalus]|uniref:C-C chemokine receptor type 4-like isoform X2 n=1 Tax=Polypterus senegalus TaxID=55291 RepID=UPI0019633135|nr:C-C chemokine receptor type 4-like isoform X2 [Polypterus senegalus]
MAMTVSYLTTFMDNFTEDPLGLGTTDYDYADPCTTDSSEVLGKHFLMAVFPLIFVLGLIGNIMVLWTLVQYVHLKTMTDICLFNLAISDLIVVISIPFWMSMLQATLPISDICGFMKAITMIGFYSSILFVTLMSVDRYLAVVHAVFAMKARTLVYGAMASAAIWLVAVCASLPEFVFARMKTENGSARCDMIYPAHSANTWKLIRNSEVNVLGLLIPLGIMIYCYIRIVMALMKSRIQRRHKAVKLVFMIVFIFILFWVPYNIALFLHSLQQVGYLITCEATQKLMATIDATEMLALTHCCVNPVIYAFAGEKFRNHMSAMFNGFRLCTLVCKRTRGHLAASEMDTSNTIV